MAPTEDGQRLGKRNRTPIQLHRIQVGDKINSSKPNEHFYRLPLWQETSSLLVLLLIMIAVLF